MTDEDDHKPKQKSAKPDKRVFDVMRPGRAPASATSRPVIMGHKPQVADDQFVPGPNSRLAGDPDEKRPLMDSDKKVGVAPLPDSTPDTAAAEVTPPSKSAVPPVDTAPAKPSEQDQPVEPLTAEPQPADTVRADQEESIDVATHMPAAPDADQEPADEGVSSPVLGRLAIDTKGEPKPPISAETHEQFAKPMTPDEVLAETDAPTLERAVVSHHKTHYASPGKWILIFLAIILLALVALNFLLDAEVVTTDFDIPHTDFLKND